MKLINEWKRAYRMLSVQAMTLALAIQGVWPEIPAEMKASLPQHLVHWVSMALLLAGIFGRLVKQESVVPKAEVLSTPAPDVPPLKPGEPSP
jgi:hypothetical protein